MECVRRSLVGIAWIDEIGQPLRADYSDRPPTRRYLDEEDTEIERLRMSGY